MFRKEDGAIDMVSLILTVVIPNVSRELCRDESGSNNDGWTGGCSQHGKLNAKYRHLRPVELADKRTDQYRNCIYREKLCASPGVKLPRIGIVRSCGSLYHRYRSRCSW